MPLIELCPSPRTSPVTSPDAGYSSVSSSMESIHDEPGHVKDHYNLSSQRYSHSHRNAIVVTDYKTEELSLKAGDVLEIKSGLFKVRKIVLDIH